jgi:hypothetical protein
LLDGIQYGHVAKEALNNFILIASMAACTHELRKMDNATSGAGI